LFSQTYAEKISDRINPKWVLYTLDLYCKLDTNPYVAEEFIKNRPNEVLKNRAEEFLKNLSAKYQTPLEIVDLRNLGSTISYNNCTIIMQYGSIGIGFNKGKVKAEKIAGIINEAQNEALQIIESLRQKIKALDNQVVRSEALEHLDDMETEMQSLSPRESRLRASLFTLWNVLKDTPLVVNAVAELAERFGVQLPPLHRTR
jgi:hypothetical protein